MAKSWEGMAPRDTAATSSRVLTGNNSQNSPGADSGVESPTACRPVGNNNKQEDSAKSIYGGTEMRLKKNESMDEQYLRRRRSSQEKVVWNDAEDGGGALMSSLDDDDVLLIVDDENSSCDDSIEAPSPIAVVPDDWHNSGGPAVVSHFSSEDLPELALPISGCSDNDNECKTKRGSCGSTSFKYWLSSSASANHQQTTTSGKDCYVYRGIPSNPPEITFRGSQRGNSALMHRKAWLEVSDYPKHRYGKNLRLYYKHWESLGCPTKNFFDWLDSEGEAAGDPLPSMDECPREALDSDTVLYITEPEVTNQYALELVSDDVGRCRVLDAQNTAPVVTGPDGWIFVMRDNVFYGAEKVTSTVGQQQKQRFHHSSFFGGKAVAAAGIFITDDNGYLTLLYPHSGHYRPGEADMQRTLYFFFQQGIDLSTFQVDTQQLIHVNRHDKAKNKNREGKKKKKVDSLHLKPALEVADSLSHKAKFIQLGVMCDLQQLSGNLHAPQQNVLHTNASDQLS